MSAGLHKLELAARGYALAAVRADREGRIQEAIDNYKKAIEILKKMTKLYPDNPMMHVYRNLIQQYEKRLNQLEKLGVPATPAEAEQMEDWIVLEKPPIRFRDIADLEHAKQAITESIIYPIKRPDLFPLGWPRGILLFGPPGCGKTMLAAAVANEIEGVFFSIDAASIMSKWLGEAEKKVRLLFEKARGAAKNGKPAVIFIDEIDALFGVYESEVGGEVRVRNQFLKEMDGLRDKSSRNLHVYVIGATNKPWKLDWGFIRRFQKRVYIPPPDTTARIKIFKLYLSKLKVSPDIDLDYLARLTEGYSASDIKDIIMEAHLRTIRELFIKNSGRGEPRPISMEDLVQAINSRKPSITTEMIKAYEQWYKKFGG